MSIITMPQALATARGTSPTRRRTSRYRRTDPRAVIASFLVVATLIAYAAYCVAPDGIGGLFYAVMSAVLLLTIIAAPLVQGVRPRRIWAFEVLGGLLMLGSLASAVAGTLLGAVPLADVLYYLGYGSILVWLALLSRHLGSIKDTRPILDGVAAALGVALATWASVLNRFLSGEGLPTGEVWAVYPTVDVALLVIGFLVDAKLQGRVLALRIFIATLFLHLMLDLVHSVVPELWPGTYLAPLYGGYLLCFLGFACATLHPSVLDMCRQPRRLVPKRHRSDQTWLSLLALLPVILTTAVPTRGPVDQVVRTTLVAVLLALLFLRLRSSLQDLASAEADSWHRATHDQLTGLHNRAAMLEMLTRRLDHNTAEGRRTAVLFLDCDGFKHVNDTWGHHAGDTLLRDIAARLPEHLRDDEILTRHGGDEFVILASVDHTDEAASLARRVRTFFDTPLRILTDDTHAVTPSIGVAVTDPGETTTTDAILQRADVAMYEAKRQGRGRFVVFGDALAALSRNRANVGARLAEAIRADAIHTALLPVMGGENYTHRLGWEALARWHDPAIGEVSPGLFIPMAEHLGLIHELGNGVLRSACRDAARLREAFPDEDPYVAVNVSPAQLRQPGYAHTVHLAAAGAGLPARNLRVEITETALVDGGPSIVEALEELREIGVGICIDDFGTGYAALPTLQRLPIDCVKLDRSLISNSADDDAAAEQLGAVLHLIRSLGITEIVAEGVETPEQARLLRHLGCPSVQGWLYGRPATVDALLERAPVTL